MAVGNEGRKRKRKVERPGADDRLKPHRPVKKAIELVKNSLSAPMELPTSLYVEADDPDFPRGGGVVPSPKEEAEARMEAEDVFERGKKDSRKKVKTGKKGSKRPPADIEDDLSSFFGNDLRFDPECPLRELKISASEERLLKDDMPRTEDEIEKLVRVSPNCSFVWIKYMAYILSLADIEKARSIAESSCSQSILTMKKPMVTKTGLNMSSGRHWNMPRALLFEVDTYTSYNLRAVNVEKVNRICDKAFLQGT